MVWPTLHFPIFLADCDQGAVQFGAFCQSKKSIKFSFRLTNLLLLQRLFQSQAMWFDPYCPFKKKKKELHSICVLLIKTFIQKLYSPVFYTSFHKKHHSFFLYLHHFRKIESDNMGLPIKKERSIFFKSTYGLNYVAFSDMSRNFRSRYHTILTILLFEEFYISLDQKLFFYFKYFLKTPIKNNMG